MFHEEVRWEVDKYYGKVLVDYMHRQLLKSHVLHCDETHGGSNSVNMAGNAFLNVKTMNSLPVSVGIVPPEHATGAAITVVVALTNTFTIQPKPNVNTE